MASDMSTVELATELTVAWLRNHNTRTNANDVPAFLRSMHVALEKLAAPVPAEPASEPSRKYIAATTARKSLASREHIISMIDGKQYRSLRRHLSANGLTPDEYRQRYRLKPDYPMTAPAYSEARSAMAKTIGLGRKSGQKLEQVVEQVAAPIKAAGKRARKSAAEAREAARAHLGERE